MSEWEHATIYPSGEIASPKTGFRWKLAGEVMLSLFLGNDTSGRGRFEMAYVIDRPLLAEQLPGLVDRNEALSETAKGNTFIDEPFWRGYSPEELEKYCEERLLPLPQLYREHWQSCRNFLSD